MARFKFDRTKFFRDARPAFGHPRGDVFVVELCDECDEDSVEVVETDAGMNEIGFTAQSEQTAKITMTTGARAEVLAKLLCDTKPEGRKTTEFYALVFLKVVLGIVFVRNAIVLRNMDTLTTILLPGFMAAATIAYGYFRERVKCQWLRSVFSAVESEQ